MELQNALKMRYRLSCRKGGVGHELEILQWLKVERGYLKEQVFQKK